MEKRNKLIDIAKGICVILIVLDHYTGWEQWRLRLLFPFWITMAVPVLMIISGYVSALSADKNGVTQLKELYSFTRIRKKMGRFLLPFFIAYGIELVLSSVSNGFGSVITKWVKDIILGGWGPGAYYTPVMMEFIFLFPLVYWIVKEKKRWGVLICLTINVAFEVFQWIIHMDGTCYKTLIFRYLFLIAVGVYFFIEKKCFSKSTSIVILFVGMVFIYLYSYRGYVPPVLTQWTGTSFLAVLFIIPIVGWLLQSRRLSKISFPALEKAGAASYHIYLTQMVYYNYVASRIYNLGLPMLLELIINVVACVVGGVLFYRAEMFLRKMWRV